MYDIHAHLCFPEFNSDRKKVVEAARNSVSGVIVSSARLEESLCVLDLVKKHPGFLFASIGHHPVEGSGLEETMELIKANANSIAAIGEVGLDFHWVKDAERQEQQKKEFSKLISLARLVGKPLVIHSWDAEREAFEMVNGKGVQAAFHCYTGPKDLAMEIAEAGFYVSISTNIMFSKKIRQTAKALPLDRMLLETDSPFLDPDRERKRNTPGNIRLSAEKIAELRGISLLEVA